MRDYRAPPGCSLHPLHDQTMASSSSLFLSPRPSSQSESNSAPLLLTIRFSASIPDLPLEVSHPEITTAAGLKQLIRARLPTDLSNHRLRLIYAGRGLEDAVSLSAGLKLPALPAWTPPAVDNIILNESSSSGGGGGGTSGSETYNELSGTRKGKGKEPVRDPPLGGGEGEGATTVQKPRLYIHCSIGDIVLSDADLAAEANVASTLKRRQRQRLRRPPRRVHARSHLSQEPHEEEEDEDEAEEEEQDIREEPSSTQPSQVPSTTPAPRGFDRLLSAGFSTAEVAALRSQFLAIHALSRTPDTMPTGTELRELEDRWMDEGSGGLAGGLGGDGVGGAGGGFGDDDGGFGPGSRGAVDDMLWGAVMGFFWPVGCAMWLRREEGIWSWRKALAVGLGVLGNAFFGGMRILN